MPRRGSARTTTRPPSQTSQAGPFDQWPIGMGFEYFYGFIGGETNQWQPDLYRNTTRVYPYVGNPGYNLTTDMADDAIDYLQPAQRARSEQAVLPLLRARAARTRRIIRRPEWIDKFKGKFSMGWNELRDQIFANQKKLGIIPQDAQLTPWPDRPAQEVGRPDRRREETLRAADGGLCGLSRLYRPRDRPRRPDGRGHGQARQHADHLHQRRQRRQRRRLARRHAQRDDVLQRRRGAGRGAD